MSMERLTYWCDNGHGGGKWFVAIDAEGGEDYGPHIERLAAYEDTGLEPEEIELMEKQRDLYVDACGGLPLRRIRELVQADKEERCDEPKRITVDDVKLMVAATKKTTSWDGKTAYDVPVGEGKCVESFPRAVRLWCDFLGVKFKWR